MLMFLPTGFFKFHSYLSVISPEKSDRFCQVGIIQDVCEVF